MKRTKTYQHNDIKKGLEDYDIIPSDKRLAEPDYRESDLILTEWAGWYSQQNIDGANLGYPTSASHTRIPGSKGYHPTPVNIPTPSTRVQIVIGVLRENPTLDRVAKTSYIACKRCSLEKKARLARDEMGVVIRGKSQAALIKTYRSLEMQLKAYVQGALNFISSSL